MAGQRPIAVIAALVGNLLIAVAKLTAGILAGSAAMLAEAAHSFSDVGNQILLLIGVKRSQKPPSHRHPFGTGKAQYFWPMLVAVLLFGLAGGYSLFEGIRKLQHPHTVEDAGLSLAILGGAFIVESITIYVALRQARRDARQERMDVRTFLQENRDATLLTVIVEDGLALASLPLAAAAISLSAATGDPVYDAVGSIAIGVLLMGFALFLGAQIRAMLIGLGLSEHDLEQLRRLVRAHPGTEGLQKVQSMHLGPHSVLLGAEVVVAPGMDVTVTLETLEASMRESLPSLRHVYLEPA